MAIRTEDIRLDATGIDAASELAEAFLVEAKLDRRSVLSARLSFESCLLNLRAHFGDGAEATLVTGRVLGRPRLSVGVPGERYDPRDKGEFSDWEHSLMETAGISPAYAYRGKTNYVSLSQPLPELGSTAISFFAILLGVALSYAGGYLSDGMRQMLLEELIDPMVSTFVSVLSGVAGPLVFMSVAWGICGIGDMASLGRSGKALIGRFLRADVLATLLTLAVCVPLFPVKVLGAAGSAGALGSMVELLLGLLPTNMVQPFVESNTLQIIVLAVVVGVSALALGDRSDGVRQALCQLNTLVQFLMEQVCRLLPGFIVVMMVSQAWSGTASALLNSWMPITLGFALAALFLVVRLVVTCLVQHVSPRRLVMVCFPVGFVAFTTASLSAAFGAMLSTCEDELGVDGDQTSFGVPLGMVLCKPANPIMMLMIMLFCAHTYGAATDPVWYVRLGVTVLLYAIAVPPVPGGTLACYGILISAFGIPIEALGVATALDLLLDNVISCVNAVVLMLETLSAADGMGLVDKLRLAGKRS